VSVEFTLDGMQLSAEAGETILQAAERAGFRIPHLCYTEGMRADGNCRACVVEIKGERVLAPSCARKPVAGMEAWSANERARHSQRIVLELLMSDAHSSAQLRTDSELVEWARELGVGTPRFTTRAQRAPDFSHPAMEVRLEACI
jgi:formate dehydrogenase major subunit